jgi:hypothetical protein
VKVSEWLAKLSSHTIYDSVDLGNRFRKECGMEPCWPEHTVAECRKAIHARGVGGYVEGNPDDKTANGYEVAAALEKKIAGTTSWDKFMGRGSMFRASLQAIQIAEIRQH